MSHVAASRRVYFYFSCGRQVERIFTRVFLPRTPRLDDDRLGVGCGVGRIAQFPFERASITHIDSIASRSRRNSAGCDVVGRDESRGRGAGGQGEGGDGGVVYSKHCGAGLNSRGIQKIRQCQVGYSFSNAADPKAMAWMLGMEGVAQWLYSRMNFILFASVIIAPSRILFN